MSVASEGPVICCWTTIVSSFNIWSGPNWSSNFTWSPVIELLWFILTYHISPSIVCDILPLPNGSSTGPISPCSGLFTVILSVIKTFPFSSFDPISTSVLPSLSGDFTLSLSWNPPWRLASPSISSVKVKINRFPTTFPVANPLRWMDGNPASKPSGSVIENVSPALYALPGVSSGIDQSPFMYNDSPG